MTDQPSNTTDPPHDPPEHTSDQRDVGQTDVPAAEIGAACEPAAESPAEQRPAETAGPAETQADPGLSAEPAGEVAAEATEAPEAPAEPPPAEPPAEPAPAEAPPEPSELVESPADAVAETQAETAETAEDEPKSENMDWYILKVQSNREDSIREGLLRRVAIAGLGSFFGQAIVPTEKVTEFKGGKKRVTKRKLYPGYLVVEMEINDDTWFLVRETPGIGDFTGAAGHPTPMLPHEVSRILSKQEEKSEKAPKLKIGFNPGDQVKINEGTFENFEGEVDSIDQTNGQVTVMINIFGRSTPVTLEYWQIESV